MSNQASKTLAKLLSSTSSLEFLNLSYTIFNLEPARKIFDGLYANSSIQYLNLSRNKFSHYAKEYGSRIGRLIQIHPRLVHLDIQFCKLTKEEILYICGCVRNSISLMAIHLGMNNIDLETRQAARAILNADVKFPFRSILNKIEKIKTAEDKY